MATRVFIDGREGTTGLRIFDRLSGRDGIELMYLPEETRKDPAARKDCIHAADVAIFCLPDAAAKESAALAEGSGTRILDTSTAHRVAPGWAYGFPELGADYRRAVVEGDRVAVPGCHASGFIALTAPLVQAGLLPKDALLSCFSLTGYSGGGKKMIAQYEAERTDIALNAPRQYGLGQTHKHLPEMRVHSGLDAAPIFAPIVADYYAGMEMTVPVFAAQLRCGADPMREVLDCLKAHYAGSPIVRVVDPEAIEGGFAPANAFAGKDTMELTVLGNPDRLQLMARYDNLGKGASGAAVQCLNLMLGLNEAEGLEL